MSRSIAAAAIICHAPSLLLLLLSLLLPLLLPLPLPVPLLLLLLILLLLVLMLKFTTSYMLSRNLIIYLPSSSRQALYKPCFQRLTRRMCSLGCRCSAGGGGVMMAVNTRPAGT